MFSLKPVKEYRPKLRGTLKIDKGIHPKALKTKLG